MFELIKQPRSDNDKHTKYDVVLDKDYIVEEFIDAIARKGLIESYIVKGERNSE